jgi:uncharacterized protein (DUF1810 family)
MEDTFNLNRFITAQQNDYETALNEIKNGRKESHWMWYIFPQIDGLGKTAISKEYAIKSKEEAIAYLNHEVLGARLIQISNELLKVDNLTAEQIVGFRDVLKLKSSMSLFALIQNDEPIFEQVLCKYYGSKFCRNTVSFLKSEMNKT